MSAKVKLLDAALQVIREQGYSASTVEDLSQATGVTKDAFFHHFLAVAATDNWAQTTNDFFATASYHELEDPLDRVLCYVAFRKQIPHGELSEITCLVGTMVQETYASNPKIRDACANSITAHAALIERDIELAEQQHSIDADWTAASLAFHTQAVIQGAFILATATGNTQVAADSIDYLRRTIECLFHQPALNRAI